MMLAPGLPAKYDHNCRLAVGEAQAALVFDRVLDLCHIAQSHCRAITVCDHERSIILGMVRLVVCVDLQAAIAVLDGALGAVRIG